jgi:alpha-glucosidase
VAIALLQCASRIPVERVELRICEDGFVRYVEAAADPEDHEGLRWTARVELSGASFHYRFRVQTSGGHLHVNGVGCHPYEPSDAFDYQWDDSPAAPEWARAAVLYHLLLDRFARAQQTDGSASDLAPWSAPVLAWPAGAHQFYGGDLAGVREQLDHIQGLGATAIVLTPFFPAPEFHRYCASSFSTVDPLLGGADALAALAEACHGCGMRLVGDLTLNHCGSEHPWFVRARADDRSDEARMFIREPDGSFAYFHGVETLPKLNYAHEGTWAAMVRSTSAPVRAWLGGPRGLDGWRLDVATMAGRHRGFDRNAELARAVVENARAEHEAPLLFAEVPHDPGSDVGPRRWSGAWLDAPFLSPVRTWLAPDSAIGGHELIAGLRSHAARLSWRSLVSSVTLVGSHDHSRLASIVASSERAAVAHFLLMTYPPIPMLHAGDEFGVEGATADEGRQPLPWPGSGREPTFSLEREIAELTRLRREHAALRDGGMRWVAGGAGAVAFVRACHDEIVLLAASRDATSLEIHVSDTAWDWQPLIGSATRCRCSAITWEAGGPEYAAWRLVAA